MKTEVKNATREFVMKGGIAWNHCLGVTLTMKQAYDGEILDEINASRNLRHFLIRLNKRVLKSSFVRHGRRLNVIPAVEYNGRLHYHLLLEIPMHQDGCLHNRNEFKRHIIEQWEKTSFGHHEICINDLSLENPAGWVEYITKFEHGEADQLDWENYHWITE